MVSDTDNDAVIYAKNNTQATTHPFWSALAGYLDDYLPVDQSCPDDDTSPACLAQSMCDKTLRFATIDDLKAAEGDFPAVCTGFYALKALNATLDQAMDNYTTVNSGYDQVFGYYQEYVKDIIPDALNEFMDAGDFQNTHGGPGNKYFDCTFQSGSLVETQQCPWTAWQLLSYYDYYITYTLKNSTGFYSELSSTYGINSTWVKFGTVERRDDLCAGHGRTCITSDIKIIGIPQKADDVDVPNPKDVISNALPNIQALQNTIFSRMTDLAVSAWYGPTDDILQVVSMPVFMIQQAINSMANAKSLGQQQEKRDRINLILEILGVVFIFVPFLDDMTLELEALDGIFSTVAAAGNVVLTIQSIIADPTSAPMQLLGLLTAGGTRDEGDFAKMASRRREISEDDLGKIGSFYKEADDDFQDVIKQACTL